MKPSTIKSVIFLLCNILCIQFIYSQKKLKLQDCIQIAYSNRVEIKHAIISTQSAKYELVNAKAQALPTLNANYLHNLNYNATNSPLFGNYNGNFSFSGSAPIFNWLNIWKTINLSQTSLSQENHKALNQKFEIYIDVTEKFYTLMFRKEKLLASKQQLSITDSILINTKTLYSLGKIMQNDVEESKLQHIKEMKDLNIALNEYKLSRIELKKSLQIEDSIMIDFEYYENVGSISENLLNDYYTYEAIAIENNPYLKILNSQIDYLNINHDILKTQNRPSLSINYSASSGYSELFLNTNNFNINKNVENSFGGLIALNLTMPIINNKNHKTKILLSKNNIEMQEYTNQAELLILKSILRRQFSDTKSSFIQFKLAEQEMESITSILENRLLLYTIGKDDIFTLLSYKKQYNNIENAYILLKFETLLKTDILNLYYNGL